MEKPWRFKLKSGLLWTCIGLLVILHTVCFVITRERNLRAFCRKSLACIKSCIKLDERKFKNFDTDMN